MDAYKESPYSVTYSLKDNNGFPLLFTIRADEFKTMVDKMDEAKLIFINAGYIGDTRGYGKKEKEYVEGRVCPKDGGRLVKVTTSKGPAVKCENSRWNPATKQAEGCTFFEWVNSQAPSQSTPQTATPNVGEPATQPQKNLIMTKFPDLWKDGMTKTEATELIRVNLSK